MSRDEREEPISYRRWHVKCRLQSLLQDTGVLANVVFWWSAAERVPEPSTSASIPTERFIRNKRGIIIILEINPYIK